MTANEPGKKPLPEVLDISQETMLPADYVIIRGMESKRAYRSLTFEPGQFVSLKIVADPELGYQLMIHIRFQGRDFWFGGSETIDIDAYVGLPFLSEELLVVLKDMEEAKSE